MSLATHTFNGKIINQLSEDTIINGFTISKGYVNATEICKANGKQWKRYVETKQFIEYIHELECQTGKTSDVLIITVTTGINELRGTWVHHLIALDLASWISAKFKVWANTTLWHVINGNFQALTPEAQKAQKELQNIWQRVRNSEKITRRSMTDSIKDWCERNGKSEKITGYCVYCSDLLNIHLFGIKSSELKIQRNVPKNRLLRDYMTEDELYQIGRIEDRLTEIIDLDNIKPTEAINLVIERMKKRR